MITDIVSTTGMLLAFVVILFLAWQASRYLGKNAPYGNKGGKMRILEQLKVGNDQYIILLKLDEKQVRRGSRFWNGLRRRKRMNELITGLNGGNVPALDIIMLLTFAALLPSIVVMMSSFMRIIIILSFTRNAMGVQQTPPNMVLTGMALFLSLYIMSPVIGQINTVAYEPYKNGEITQQEAVSRMADPLKQFMLRNTEKDTLDHFVQMSKQEVKKDVKEYPLTVVVPAFMTSELKKGFLAGFLIYLPFLLIDIVVSTTLMSMGMVMLPPTMVSLPFKLLLFITVNGWELLFSSLVQSFR